MGFITSKDTGWRAINWSITTTNAAEVVLRLRGPERQMQEVTLAAITPEWDAMQQEVKASKEFVKLERLKAALLANEAAQAEAKQQLEQSEKFFGDAIGEGNEEMAFDACPQFSSQRIEDLQQEHRVLARATHDAYHEAKAVFSTAYTKTQQAIVSDAGELRRQALERFLQAAAPALDELAHAAKRHQHSDNRLSFESLAGSLPQAAAKAAREAAERAPLVAGVGNERSIVG